MTGRRMLPRHSERFAVLVCAVALVACSSTNSKSASTRTTEVSSSKAAAEATITKVVGPDSLPAGLVDCVYGKLPVSARDALSKGQTPDVLAFRVIRAGAACNRGWMIRSLAPQLTAFGPGVGLTAAQKGCVATNVIDEVLADTDSQISAGGAFGFMTTQFEAALQTCYPVKQFMAAIMRRFVPGLTDAQINCVSGKLGNSLSWKAITEGGSAVVTNALSGPVRACQRDG